MNTLIFILSVLFGLMSSLAPPPASAIYGVFVGTSPCDAVSRERLGIPGSANCEMIKWNLTLFQHPSRLNPTTYELKFTYGMPQPNTNGLIGGGTTVATRGKWTMVQGTKSDPNAVTVQLVSKESEKLVSFLKLDHDLLHLLDSDRKLAVGNGGWSYTLSRKENFRQQTRAANAAATPSPQLTSLTDPSSPGATPPSVLGRFVGRSPCVDVARELGKTVGADCMKVKWDLTLYHDSKTLAPTTYKLRGTFYRDRIKEGTWTILSGANVNAAAVVYQLEADASQGPLLFLKADDDVLLFLDRGRNLMVGNSDFSYTLNRAK